VLAACHEGRVLTSFHQLEWVRSDTMCGHDEKVHSPRGVRELLRVLKEFVADASEHRAVGEVEQVCERDLITRKIFLLGENLLVASEFALELSGKALGELLVGAQAEERGEHQLEDDVGGEVVEVGGLDRGSLFEEGGLLRIGGGIER
jgi:hypothetical protein